MLETLIGCLVGALVTWFFSFFYYKRAGDDLKKEAQELHRQTQLILVALEQGGLIELRRENGKIIGFERWLVRQAGWESSAFGNSKVGRSS